MQHKHNQTVKYVLSGTARKKYKKELSLLRQYIRNFWYFHKLEKDMCPPCKNTLYPMSDEQAQKLYNKACTKALQMQYQLALTV